MTFLKPKRLQPGDTVAVLSPSWGGPSIYPHVFDLGLRNIEKEFGLRIKEYPTARMSEDAIYANPKLRADDINQAFSDPEVSAIFASIGGDDSVRILPFLDLPTILANPKILMGYSDTTVLTTYLNCHGMVTYNGPSVMAGFAQLRHLPRALNEHIRHLLMDDATGYEYRPYKQWADYYANWGTAGYDGETASLVENTEGFRWVQGEGAVVGRLYGGCIEVMEFLKGTRFWPSESFFEGKILFFETSEDKPSVGNVKYMLRNYGSMGVLDQISGILFGRARSYTQREKADLEKVLVQVVAGEFGRADMPIVCNVDFGHTDPQLIMPLGVEITVNAATKQILINEPAVA